MPNKQSIILSIAVWITGFIIAVIGVNVIDVNGNTTQLGSDVGKTGIIIFISGFVFLFLPDIGKKLG
jgi:hypothetical protein